MTIRQSTINKYITKCSEKGFEYINSYKSTTFHDNIIECKCLFCDYINKCVAVNLISGKISCSNCLLNKYTEKCLELGFVYESHYRKKTTTLIKAKCNVCSYVNDFDNSALFKNSVRCKCSKKTFSKGYIYKLNIGSYYYIGLTDTTLRNRYAGHKRSCFNKSKKDYHSRKYKVIRSELCRITKKSVGKLEKKHFDKYVIQTKVATITTTKEDLKSLESMLINLDNPWCINSIL